jgi:hypothetical protein
VIQHPAGNPGPWLVEAFSATLTVRRTTLLIAPSRSGNYSCFLSAGQRRCWIHCCDSRCFGLGERSQCITFDALYCSAVDCSFRSGSERCSGVARLFGNYSCFLSADQMSLSDVLLRLSLPSLRNACFLDLGVGE